jgi:ribosomal protein S18 acetylase RimI-like enzyme
MLRDDWLSEILGYPVYVVEDGSVPPAGDERALLYAKVPVVDVARAAELHAHGFGVVDVNVVLTLSETHAAAAASAASVAPLDPADADAVLDIAGSCFRLSRFHLDPRVADADASRIKREWIRSYVEGTRGEELLVAHAGGRPAGFLAVLADGGARVIDLVGVATEAQGRGVGSALVAAFVERHAPYAHELRVGTQVSNVRSLSLYQAHGFRISGSAYVLHRHDG